LYRKLFVPRRDAGFIVDLIRKLGGPGGEGYRSGVMRGRYRRCWIGCGRLMGLCEYRLDKQFSVAVREIIGAI
jgi:hypothetical protein